MPRGRSGVFCFWLRPATPGFAQIGSSLSATKALRDPRSILIS